MKVALSRSAIVAIGMASTAAITAGWHGPLGAGDRLATGIETTARATLDRYEMAQVDAALERQPLSRRLILSGPADAFQRRELVRILSEIPGVAEVRWDPASLPQEAAR